MIKDYFWIEEKDEARRKIEVQGKPCVRMGILIRVTKRGF